MSVLRSHASTFYPTVQAKVGIETGSGDVRFRSRKLLFFTKLNLKPTRKEQRSIEQTIGAIRTNVEVCNVTIQSLAVEGFSFQAECFNAEKDELTYLPNPNILALKKQYSLLRRVNFGEEDIINDSMRVHIILGAADYQRIRTTEPLIMGAKPDKDPGAEFTMVEWTFTEGNSWRELTQ